MSEGVLITAIICLTVLILAWMKDRKKPERRLTVNDDGNLISQTYES